LARFHGTRYCWWVTSNRVHGSRIAQATRSVKRNLPGCGGLRLRGWGATSYLRFRIPQEGRGWNREMRWTWERPIGGPHAGRRGEGAASGQLLGEIRVPRLLAGHLWHIIEGRQSWVPGWRSSVGRAATSVAGRRFESGPARAPAPVGPATYPEGREQHAPSRRFHTFGRVFRGVFRPQSSRHTLPKV